MSAIQMPSVDFPRLKNEAQDGRFTSNKIKNFALDALAKIEEENAYVTRAFEDFQEHGNRESKNFILARIRVISSRCTQGYPDSTKVKQLGVLKDLLHPIAREYDPLATFLTADEVSKERGHKTVLSACGGKKGQLLKNEQLDYHKNPIFQTFLSKIKEKYDECEKQSIYFAYAWPTDFRHEREDWVQNFLKKLQKHLKAAGFNDVRLDIISGPMGNDINTFMQGARTSGYVLLFGTESLLDKFQDGTTAVSAELNHIMHKRREDKKRDHLGVFPILLSGTIQTSYPPEYERFVKAIDWRGASYLQNFKKLVLELLGLPPENHMKRIDKYWKDVCGQSAQSPPPKEWYKTRREEIDACMREANIRYKEDQDPKEVLAELDSIPESRHPS